MDWIGNQSISRHVDKVQLYYCFRTLKTYLGIALALLIKINYFFFVIVPSSGGGSADLTVNVMLKVHL